MLELDIKTFFSEVSHGMVGQHCRVTDRTQYHTPKTSPRNKPRHSMACLQSTNSSRATKSRPAAVKDMSAVAFAPETQMHIQTPGISECNAEIQEPILAIRVSGYGLTAVESLEVHVFVLHGDNDFSLVGRLTPAIFTALQNRGRNPTSGVTPGKSCTRSFHRRKKPCDPSCDISAVKKPRSSEN